MDRDDEWILELRIHGMNNTAPHDLLELPQSDVELWQGDSMGSFWTPTAEAVDRARQRASADPERRAHVVIPTGVRREAYSWGPMARTSPVATTAGPTQWLSIIARAGWLLLIPFGLANGAYWTRRLLPRPGVEKVVYGRGAALVRLFGYGLTLLGVCALVTVSNLEVATWRLATDSTCRREPSSEPLAGCRTLPQWVDQVAGLTWPQRIALGSLVPVVVLAGLWWLSRGANLRYERPTSKAISSTSDPSYPQMLADPLMWTQWRRTQVSARVHLAGGIGLVTMLAATTQGWRLAAPCETVADVLGHLDECVLSTGSAYQARQLVLAALALAVVLISGAVAGWLSADRTATRTRGPRVTAGLLGVAALGLLVELWQLWVGPDTAGPVSHPGIGLTQAALLIALLLIALSGLTWRAVSRITWLVPLLGLALLVLLAWLLARPRSSVALWSVAAVAAGFVGVCVSLGGDRQREAWRGRGPGVWMLLALGAAVAGASVLVVAVGDWLNGGASVADLSSAAVRTDAQLSGERLVLPKAYVESALASAVAFALVVLMVLGYFCALAVVGRLRGSDEPLGVEEYLRDSVARARRNAALSQRGTWIVGVVALAVGIALTLAVVLAVDDAIHSVDDTRLTLVEHAWFGPVAAIGLWTISVAWSVLLIRIITAHRAPGRPVALVWDLLCFLPRAGHPLAPPSYAERAVPELAARVEAWLDGQPTSSGTTRRAVVLAAHSLGAVLAVATLMTMKPETRSRVALLTFGSQLRPYFGRILPELLGPGVLGSEPCEPRNWQGLTIWSDERPTSAGEAANPVAALARQAPHSLVACLSNGTKGSLRWINLWRATDPLGMPAISGNHNPVDHYAREIDDTTYLPVVATHSNYPRTAEYREALDTLINRLHAK